LKPAISQVVGFFILHIHCTIIAVCGANFISTKTNNKRHMTDMILSPVPVAELIDRIANEIEERLHRDTPPAPLSDRITVDEAMTLTGLTRSSLYKMTMTNNIPFSKYGKRLVFSRKQLQEWIDRRTVPADSAEREMTRRLAAASSRKMRQ